MAGRIGPQPPFATSLDRNGKRWQTKYATTTTYRNGDVIPQVTNNATWAGLTTGAWCYYNNDPANEAIYGKLYNWHAATDPRGIAPYGYRIPRLNPENFGNPQGSDFVNSSGIFAWFFAKPGYEFPSPYLRTTFSGLRQADGSFDFIDDTVFFGTSDVDINSDTWLYFSFGGVGGDETEIASTDKTYGLSLWFIEE